MKTENAHFIVVIKILQNGNWNRKQQNKQSTDHIVLELLKQCDNSISVNVKMKFH